MKVFLSFSLLVLSFTNSETASVDPSPAWTNLESGVQRETMLRGKVTNEEGDPIEGAKILMELLATVMELHQLDATSNNEGIFVIPGLRPDLQYKIRIEKDGYIPHEQTMLLEQAMNQQAFTLRLASRVTAREAYEKGSSAYRAGRLEEAVAAMIEAVLAFGDTESPNETLLAALVALGQIQLQRGELDEASAAFERALRLSPDNVFAHTGLGHVRDRQGDHQQAIGSFRRAVELQPEDPQGHFNLGSLLITAGEVEEAIEVLERCLELRPQFPQAHRSLGNAYAQDGERDKAIEHLRTYLEQMPNAPDAPQIRELIAKLQQ